MWKKILNQQIIYAFFKQFELVWTSPAPFFGCSVAVKKNSPYFKLLKMEFTDLIDYGSLDRLNMKHSNPLQSCKKTNDIGGNSLGYFKLATLFYILGIGIILSVLTFLYELFHKPIISNNDRAKIYEKQTSSNHDVVNADNEMEAFDDIFNIHFQKQCDEALNMLLNLQNEHGDLFKEFQNRRLDDLAELVY